MTVDTLLTGVMFIGAHPDDETIMAGGTLALLHEQGIPTHVVCATDGRGGESGEIAEAGTPDALARIRAEELRCAVQSLGVESLTLLEYEDPVIGPDEELFGFAVDSDQLSARIAKLIHSTGVDVVLSHGSNGEYGHPAHVQVHQAVLHAVRTRTPSVLFYSIGARVPVIEDRLWNEDDPAHLALDIGPWQEAKLAAMLCHKTQHVLFKRRRRLQHISEALRTVEAFHRHWPGVQAGGLPDDSFLHLMLACGAWHPEHPPETTDDPHD
jgi:LmbE family N-acetylglucosaminyl deacetylase